MDIGQTALAGRGQSRVSSGCEKLYSVLIRVNVSNRSSGGNHHFRDLETIANDVRKAEKT